MIYNLHGKTVPKKLLMNTGGTYTAEEIVEIWNYLNWKDPLKDRKSEGGVWCDTSKETPILPNWAYVSRRHLWVCHFAGVTLECGPSLLSAKKWILYIEGQPLGEPGELAERKDEGTALLIALKYGQPQQKETDK